MATLSLGGPHRGSLGCNAPSLQLLHGNHHPREAHRACSIVHISSSLPQTQSLHASGPQGLSHLSKKPGDASPGCGPGARPFTCPRGRMKDMSPLWPGSSSKKASEYPLLPHRLQVASVGHRCSQLSISPPAPACPQDPSLPTRAFLPSQVLESDPDLNPDSAPSRLGPGQAPPASGARLVI